MVERNAADVDPLFLDAVDLPNVNSIAFTNGVTLYSLTTAITANSTATSLPANVSLAITSNATGAGMIFVSDGSKWQLLPSGTGATLNDIQTLTNKTLTTPIIASMYQDAGKTKLMTLPNTASDTLVTLAATQTLTGKTLTAPKGVMLNLLTTVTLAQLQAGEIILANIAGATITVLNFRLVVNGTAGGSGNFILEDTNGAPVVIVTVAEAQLSGMIKPDTASITLGAGYLAPLTTAKGIQIPAAAGITTLTSVTVSIDYVLS
jgi:hypothetical protein